MIDERMIHETIHPLSEESIGYKAASALVAAICSEDTVAEDNTLEACVQGGGYSSDLIKTLIARSRSMDMAAIKQLQSAIAYSYDFLKDKHS